MSVKEMLLEIRNIKLRLSGQKLGVIAQEEQLVALLALQDSLIKSLLGQTLQQNIEVAKKVA